MSLTKGNSKASFPLAPVYSWRQLAGCSAAEPGGLAELRTQERGFPEAETERVEQSAGQERIARRRAQVSAQRPSKSLAEC